ncbi:MAG TPA: GDSL-type esterase/lipase family protein [Chloroflexia bacterium]|nr:GDSL-type esterase/lipase family protein [Chloroflexia bacterium]
MAIAAITLLLTLTLLEVGLRLFAPQYSAEGRAAILDGLLVPDPATGYRNAPGARVHHRYDEIDAWYQINAQGLRENREVGPPVPDHVRLLALGDSFTFGWGVDGAASYPMLLDGTWAASGTPVESVNAGVIGYGTDNEATWLDVYGWSLHPRVVLVGFYAGNDVRDVMLGIGKTHVDARGRLGDGTVPPAATPTGLSGLKYWLGEHSQAYLFFRDGLYNLTHGPPPTPTPLPGQALPDDVVFYLRTEPADVAAGWDKVLSLLDAMNRGARMHGARLIVISIPAHDQVDGSAWQARVKRLGLDAESVDLSHPQERLAAWGTASGVPVIDLLPGFRAAGPQPPRYFQHDSHWNVAGHALAAQLITTALARLNLGAP